MSWSSIEVRCNALISKYKTGTQMGINLLNVMQPPFFKPNVNELKYMNDCISLQNEKIKELNEILLYSKDCNLKCIPFDKKYEDILTNEENKMNIF